MPTEPLLVEIDKEKIEQALSNIVSNAVKFSDQGQIAVSLTAGARDLSISIQDQGCGVADDELPRIFQRFFQGENQRGGTGLGLSLAKLWIDTHGGHIWIKSDGEGTGATVTFTLPRVL
jgi:two-component system sensor histidine kinase VicK